MQGVGRATPEERVAGETVRVAINRELKKRSKKHPSTTAT